MNNTRAGRAFELQMKTCVELLWVHGWFGIGCEIGVMVGRDCLTRSLGKPSDRVSQARQTQSMSLRNRPQEGLGLSPGAWRGLRYFFASRRVLAVALRLDYLNLDLVPYSLVWWCEWQIYQLLCVNLKLQCYFSAFSHLTLLFSNDSQAFNYP